MRYETTGCACCDEICGCACHIAEDDGCEVMCRECGRGINPYDEPVHVIGEDQRFACTECANHK